MRAGSLDRTIVLQSGSASIADDGTPTMTWAPVATVRAHLIQASTEEYLRAYGETDAATFIFRIRWRAGIASQQRVLFEDHVLNVREIKEIGRRKGLELRCEEVRT